MEEGDLGFGRGLKPGAISTSNEDVDLSPRQRILRSSSESKEHGAEGVRRSQYGGSTRRLKRSNSLGSAVKTDLRKGGSEQEEIPMYAGVPMGTSLRQQKVLYSQNMKDFLKRKDQLSFAADIKGSAIPASFFAVQQAIVDRLQGASNEVIVLQSELEASQSQLDSKYRAIRILQSQVAALNAEKQRNINTVQDQAKVLQKEVNALQFELDAKSSSFMFSEQTWAQRFDRLSIENTALMATLQARSDEVRRLHADKTALKRERDELLAMMDANERLQYDRHWSSKNDACMNNSVSEQMAVLGSCLCRGNKPEPCRCAKTAALLKKDNSILKDENFKLNEHLQEAYLVADAFRKAFEEQLNRNSTMSRDLAGTPQGPHHSTVKDGEKNGMRRRPLQLPWMKKAQPKNGHCQREDVGQLLAETMDIQALLVRELDEVHHEGSRSVGVQVSQPMPDLIRNMAELLNDKSEALAHQRLVTKMLARRTQDLEATMKKYGDP